MVVLPKSIFTKRTFLPNVVLPKVVLQKVVVPKGVLPMGVLPTDMVPLHYIVFTKTLSVAFICCATATEATKTQRRHGKISRGVRFESKNIHENEKYF
jgi:hypothetical protein